MSNFKEDIIMAAKGQPIEAIVIGDMGWTNYGLEELPQAAQDTTKWNRVLSWTEAELILDYEYDRGFGAPGCQCITAWTPTHVLFVSQYDGATAVESVPRNPVDHKPNMPGG